MPPGVRPRILVADDDASVLRAVGRVLTSRGFDVTGVTDGREAVRLLAAEKFDAVVSDVMMPDMGGIELLRAVRSNDLELPVLLMTGAPNVDSAVAAVQYGACDYIAKPVVPDELERSVNRAVDLHQLARAKRDAMRLLGSHQAEAGDRAGLEVTFARALESLWIAYQPIVSAATKGVRGYEALLRSAEPALPNPGAVLEAAEKLQMLGELGRLIRSKAPEPLPRVEQESLLFVNLHARDLQDPLLVAPSEPLSLVAGRVVLEITERASLEGLSDVRETVTRLREIGFRIAVDDLGAGYAGLTSFAQLEPEFVKLDMSLVRGVDQNILKQKLVRSMTSLCNDMGITVVAEGVETTEERDACIELGCPLLQGYLFAKPGRAFPAVVWPIAE